MSRQDQYNISLWVDNFLTGTWDKLDGGEVDSAETKYKPGNMGGAVSLGGSIEVGNITLSRLYDLFRDHGVPGDAHGVHWLMERAGKGQCKVSRQPLDVDGHAFGDPIVYTGTLKTVTPPPVDSESADAAVIECEITPNGTVG